MFVLIFILCIYLFSRIFVAKFLCGSSKYNVNSVAQDELTYTMEIYSSAACNNVYTSTSTNALPNTTFSKTINNHSHIYNSNNNNSNLENTLVFIKKNTIYFGLILLGITVLMVILSYFIDRKYSNNDSDSNDNTLTIVNVSIIYICIYP